MAFLSLHLVIVALGLSDLVALLLFAIPITVFISYCTQDTRAQAIRSALHIYCVFASVTLAAVGLVYLIE